MADENKKDSGSWIALFIVVAVIACAIGIGIKNLTGGNSNNDNKSNGAYMDALRKCTVMEAADIYNTGIGGNRNTAFDDAKETCLSWYKSWGEEEFIEVSNLDWDDRKSEMIDGENLEHYLSILGW